MIDQRQQSPSVRALVIGSGHERLVLCRLQGEAFAATKGQRRGLLSLLFAHRVHHTPRLASTLTYLPLTHTMSRPRSPNHTHSPYLTSPERPPSKRTGRGYWCPRLKRNRKVCGRHFATLQGFKSHLRSPKNHAAVDVPAAPTPQRDGQAPPLTDGPSSLQELLLLIDVMPLAELLELQYQGALTITHLHFTSLPSRGHHLVVLTLPIFAFLISHWRAAAKTLRRRFPAEMAGGGAVNQGSESVCTTPTPATAQVNQQQELGTDSEEQFLNDMFALLP